MNKGALALLVHGGTENWSPERWKNRFDEVCRDRARLAVARCGVRSGRGPLRRGLEAGTGRAGGISEPARHLQSRRRRRCADGRSTLPNVPLVRVAVADLTERMTEYVVLHVLMHHRQELYLRASQREKRWAPKSQWPASAISVGIMGLGTLGANAAEVLQANRLSRLGLEPEPEADRRHRMLSRRTHSSNRSCGSTDILVCLLPLTPDTRHILNRGLFAKLNRNSPLGAPVLINAGRGGLQNEADILHAWTTARSAPHRSTSTPPSRCRRTARSGPIRRWC